MKRLHSLPITFLVFLGLTCSQSVYSQQAGSEEVIEYVVGKVNFYQTNKEIKLKVSNKESFSIEILPGGRLRPNFLLDDSGLIFLGNRMINSRTGAIEKLGSAPEVIWLDQRTSVEAIDKPKAIKIRHGSRQCVFSAKALGLGKSKKPSELLSDGNIKFAASDTMIVGLYVGFGSDGRSTDYLLSGIDPRTCALLYRKSLGDPDLLVEIAWTKAGGWWVTGSIEQTLIQSKDGIHWEQTKLPDELYSLVSSYVVNEREIWLAAGLASVPGTQTTSGSDNLPLVYSADSGKTWAMVNRNHPSLKNFPKYWFEGLSRMEN